MTLYMLSAGALFSRQMPLATERLFDMMPAALYGVTHPRCHEYNVHTPSYFAAARHVAFIFA